MFKNFDDECIEVFSKAQKRAKNLNLEYLSVIHLFLALFEVQSGIAYETLVYFTLDRQFKKIARNFEKVIDQKAYKTFMPQRFEFSIKTKQIIENAQKNFLSDVEKFEIDQKEKIESSELKRPTVINTGYLLSSILDDKYSVPNTILLLHGLSALALKSKIISLSEASNKKIEKEEEQEDLENKQFNIEENEEDSPIQKYTTNLSNLSYLGKIDPIFGREKEMNALIKVIKKKKKNNAILTGEPGTGKTAIVEKFVNYITELKAKKVTTLENNLVSKEIISLTMVDIVSGTKYRGEFEERLIDLLDEIIYFEKYIVFIDEIHTLIGAGSGDGATDAANIMKPILLDSNFQCIGATTNLEYKNCLEKDVALLRRFQRINIDPPNSEETIMILDGIRETFENHHKLKITNKALLACVELSDRFINDRFLPDKAIDLLDESCAYLNVIASKIPSQFIKISEKVQSYRYQKQVHLARNRYKEAKIASKFENQATDILEIKKALFKTVYKKNPEFKNLTLTENHINTVLAYSTKIPIDEISTSEKNRLINAEKIMNNKVIGQPIAISAIANALRRSSTGLKNPNRPIASFLFAGPTGVGKTELAKVVSSLFFGSEESFIRLDMSEYMESFNVSKILGSPPGYAGYEEGGFLTEKIKKRPYSLILFDEIEKANLDIFNILLQILDDGRLTDAKGTLLDFKNTIIILTSNIGAEDIIKIQQEYAEREKLTSLKSQQKLLQKEKRKQMTDSLKKSLQEKFKPEFLNRLDDIIVFEQLSRQNIIKIADRMINDFILRIKESCLITLNVEPSVYQKISKEGFNPIYGARPLRRAIRNILEDPLANYLLTENDNIEIMKLKKLNLIPIKNINVFLDEKDKTIFVKNKKIYNSESQMSKIRRETALNNLQTKDEDYINQFRGKDDLYYLMFGLEKDTE